MLVGHMVGKVPVSHLKSSDNSLIDSDTLLGVEVEIEGLVRASQNPSTSAREAGYWRSEEDNSLRDGGREFVFAEPLFGADVVSAIRFICAQAIEKKWKISERTGIHVHLDVRGMELEKFRNLCVLYALTERPLYQFVGDYRESNIHCLPWYVADSDISVLGSLFKEPANARDTVSRINRYSGLNLASLGKFGTIEFRQLKTTFNSSRIITWINLILSLKQAAEAWEGKTEQLISELRSIGAYSFLSRIYGPALASTLWYAAYSHEALGLGIPVAHEFFKASTALKKKAEHGELVGTFAKAAQNIQEEYGTNPGVTKFIHKRAPKPPVQEISTVTHQPPPLSIEYGMLAHPTLGQWVSGNDMQEHLNFATISNNGAVD